MADILSRKKRSELMRRVRSKNSGPEIAVRQAAFALGYRFRLHGPGLPGRPDLVFPKHQKVIFVHGCFWHRHSGCPQTTIPKTRVKFWRSKFEENKRRDRRTTRKLRVLGWDVLVIWGCQVRQQEKLQRKLAAFLK